MRSQERMRIRMLEGEQPIDLSSLIVLLARVRRMTCAPRLVVRRFILRRLKPMSHMAFLPVEVGMIRFGRGLHFDLKRVREISYPIVKEARGFRDTRHTSTIASLLLDSRPTRHRAQRSPRMGSSPPDFSSGPAAGLDPMMGRLEVIEPGIAMFHGFANVAFAYGGGEMLAVDTSSRQMGALAVAAIREVTQEPFAFLIYTHGHGDHAFGSEAFITDNLTRGYPRPKIWAHEEVPARFHRYQKTRGWQAHINSLQFGVRIPADGLFSEKSFSNPDLTYRDMQLLALEKEPD